MSSFDDLERGVRPGSPSSERAAKPLAHALDTTLSILMDERIAGFADKFHSMAGAIDDLTRRVAAMEADDGLSKSIDDRFSEAAAFHLSETERLLKQELQTVELQLEGKASLVDLEQLEEKVEEMDKLFEEEVEKRHAEVHDINEVLKGLEELFETRDAEYAEERRHKIESQLRKSIFHMKHRKATEAFNCWQTHVKKIRRRRHLLMMATCQWRNRHLALYWKPWLNMFRHEHRARAHEAMQQIQDHHNLATKALEERVHGLTDRIDKDLLTDAALEEALKGLEDDLQQKIDTHAKQLDEHAQHLHSKVDDGYGNLSESIEEMEAKLQQQSDHFLDELDARAAELEEKTNHHAEELAALARSQQDKSPAALTERLSALEELLHGREDEQEVSRRPVHGSKPASDTDSGLLAQVQESRARIDAMEDNYGAKAHDQIETNLIRVETLIKEEIETIELQLEGKTALADLELLEEKVEEMDKLFEEEVEKRHAEVHDINEVLKGLEELFETRDAEYAEERRHKIESQLRKSIFHMKRQQMVSAFNCWQTHVKKIRRGRHLLMMATCQWRNRHLALYWKPWLNMFRHEHRARAHEAMQQIQDHHNLATKALEERVHGLTDRIDKDLLTDEVLEEALKGIQAQLHEKEQELQSRMQDHADHLHAKVDDGHGNLSQSVEEMEAKLQHHSDDMLNQLNARATELRELHEANHALLGEKVDGNHEHLVTWLDKKDKASADAKMRSILFKMQHKLMSKAFVEWEQAVTHAKYEKRHRQHEGAIRQLHDMLSEDELAAVVKRIDGHDTTIKRLLKELGIEDINSYEAAGAVQRLIKSMIREHQSNHDRQRKEIHIDRLLRNVAARWSHRDCAAAFNAWAKFAKKQKRSENLATKCVLRIDNLAVARTFLPWLRVARETHDNRQDQAMDAFMTRARELEVGLNATKDDLHGTMNAQRKKWIDMTLRRVIAKWHRGIMKTTFDRWHEEAVHNVRLQHDMRKAVAIMDNFTVAMAFGPWLAASRQLKDEKLLAHTYAVADEATTRLDSLEQQIGEKHSTTAQQFVDLQNSMSQIQTSAAQDKKDINDQLATMHEKLEELGHIGDVDRLQKEIEDRLEHLEVSLREEFQHVEVRCDIVSREFNRLCGKEWKDGLPPNKQPLDGLFAAESSAGRQLQELQESMGVVKKETELLREFMHSDRQLMGVSPRSGGSSEEGLDSLRRSVRDIEATVERVSELKASVQHLQQQTESVRSKQTDTTEALAAQLGEVGGLKKQLDALASTVSSQAAASIDTVQLKVGVSSVEREISTMRNEQQRLGAVDANHSASIAGLKAELDALRQAHTHTQNITRDLQSVVGDTRSEVKASGSQLQTLEQAVAATKAQVATNSTALQETMSGLDGKVARISEHHEQQEQAAQMSRMIEEQVGAAAQFDTQMPEEGDPPSPVRATAMMDELGFVTRRIATLQLEQEVLAQAAEENPGATARLEEVVQELSALESALDQLGVQVGMDPSPAPSEYDDDESYDGEGADEYGQDDSRGPGPARQFSTRRRPDRLRAARSRPSGPTDREAAWARAHAHAFGRASMKPNTG